MFKHLSTEHTGLEGLEELSGDRNMPMTWVEEEKRKKSVTSKFVTFKVDMCS